MPERNKKRTTDQITADMLVKRLHWPQLLQLVGVKEFSEYQDEILEVLSTIPNLSTIDFKKVHVVKGCEIEEVELDETVHLTADTEFGFWGKHVNQKELRCESHKIASITFFTHNGVVWEKSIYRDNHWEPVMPKSG